MFILKGIIKEDKNEPFVRKDGTPGVKRELTIDQITNHYPLIVGVPMGVDYGPLETQIEIEVSVFPFCFVNKQRQRALLAVYVPETK